MTKSDIILEKLSKKKKRKSNVMEGVVKPLLPGAVGGAITQTVVSPLDVTKDSMRQWKMQAAQLQSRAHGMKSSPVKTRMLQEAGHLKQDARSLASTAKAIFRGSGAKGFYAGYTGQMLKTVPAMAITFMVAEEVRKRLKKK